MPKKQYADPAHYESKLTGVMKRLGADQFDFDYSRRDCWVSFRRKGQWYRFEHSTANAKARGIAVQFGSDCFAQVVLALEDLARMAERGIYELETWITGMKSLPPATVLPEPFAILGFNTLPSSPEEVKARYRELARTTHPDAGGTEEQFKQVSTAYEAALGYLSADEEA